MTQSKKRQRVRATTPVVESAALAPAPQHAAVAALVVASPPPVLAPVPVAAEAPPIAPPAPYVPTPDVAPPGDEARTSIGASIARIDDLVRRHRHLVLRGTTNGICGVAPEEKNELQSFVYVSSEQERQHWQTKPYCDQACPACVGGLESVEPIAPPPSVVEQPLAASESLAWIAFFPRGRFALMIAPTRDDAAKQLEKMGYAVDDEDIVAAVPGDAFSFEVDEKVGEYEEARTPFIVPRMSEELRTRIAAHMEISSFHDLEL